MGGRALDLSESGYGQRARSCENDVELPGFINFREFLCSYIKICFQRTTFFQWSYLVSYVCCCFLSHVTGRVLRCYMFTVVH